MAEIEAARETILPWLQGCVVDLGCGRNKICDYAIGIDYAVHYGGMRKGHIRDTVAEVPSGWEAFAAFCRRHRAQFDTVCSSHLLEDYARPYQVLAQWLQLVRIGGRMILLLPVEAVYREAAGEKRNHAHQVAWEGAADFIARMPEPLCKRVSVLHGQERIGKWSFLVVMQREA